MKILHHAGVVLLSLFATVAVSNSQNSSSTAAKAVADDRPIAITGAKLLTITHGTIENGVLVMTAGKISAVGDARFTAIPKGAQIIDGKGMTVYPGLIDSETNLGLTEVEADRNNNDLSEPGDEIMAHMHVYDAFHAETERIPIVRYNGVTNAVVAPAPDDTMAGQDIFIQLAGRDRDEMILVRDLALAMNFSGDQRRLTGGFEKAKYPMTRMGMASQLRQACLDAQDYSARQADYERKEAEWKKGDHKAPEPTFKRDLKLEALLPYLSGAKPVVLGTYASQDVETAMSLAQEFHLRVILNHITHTQEILDKIASYHVPVIVGPIYDEPLANQRYDAVFSLPAELVKRGVKIAMASYRVQDNRNLPYAAGYAVAYGLPYDEAMKAITINPAEMWGVADQLGSLDVGKTANVVIANGDPLDVRTDVKQVFIGGKAMPMVNRQTRLRDEYTK
jgi:imidazolonepropionase-like amidohydrolase